MRKRRAESRKGMVVTTVALDPELHHRLAIAAVEERAAITELVRQAVAEWLARRDGRTKRKGRR
jgi:predicted transcriptional regulator